MALELAGALVAVGLILFSGMIFLRRLKARRAEVADEAERSTRFVADRAYNQVRIARAEADVLDRRGIDVRAPQRQLEEAEAASARRDFDGALRLARSAHDSLVRLKDRPAMTAPPPAVLPVPSLEIIGPVGATAVSDDAGARPRPGPIPRNKAESRFQMKLLESDLAASGDPSGEGVAEARRLLGEATTAFDRGDFTAALGLALRGRRRAGARLESLAPTPLRGGAPTPPSADSRGGLAPPAEGAEGAAEGCPVCGAPMRAADRFCRGCGTPRDPARCAACGTPIVGSDRFCGGCGAALPPATR